MEITTMITIIWILGAISVVVGGRLYHLHIKETPWSFEKEFILEKIIFLTIFGSILFPFAVIILIILGIIKLIDIGIKKLYINLIK